MARKRKGIGARGRLVGVLLVVALLAAAWGWWQLRYWTPAADRYPDQGAEIGAADGAVRFETLRALGAGFVYLQASASPGRRDGAFAANLSSARDAGLKVGAVHRFDPCAMADRQSAEFVTMVPRGAALLPPAIALEALGEDCPSPVAEAEIESELLTLINQIEAHAGKPAILQVSKAFERRYRLAGRIERNLWVVGTRFQPTYAGRPWLMWTANTALVTEASDGPLRWVVVRK